MAPDPSQPPAPSLGDLPTVGCEGGDPPRRPPPTTGLADDGDAPEVPGYEVVRPLGRGGMGVVYLARQVSLNRPVALKLLPVGRLGELGRKRFQAEAESAARVAHPGIAQVYQIGEHAGRPYFALEYCPGGSLADKLAGTPLPPRQAAELVAAVARAVAAAHAAGVVHRDLKPDNVLFAADRTPKVADFGLAKPVQADSHLTTDGAILGTPSYMAPEQARGDSKVVGPAADVYALGAVLYECLTGRPPFRAATLMETLSQVLSADPVPPRKLQPGVPKDLDTVALKCLEKDPAKRYASATAVADDLRAFLDGRPILARPLGRPGQLDRWARRRPAVAGLLLGNAALVVFIIALLAQTAASARRQRDAARQAQRSAEAGRAEADAQRRKADARLAAAVEAVGGVAALADGEAWVLNADLQPERRKLLAAAVGFYERLAAGQDDDPTVQAEAARSHLRAGRAWLGLGELEKAAAALGRAAELADARRATGPAAVALAAECHLYRGHAVVILARYQEAWAAYQAALARAEAAVAGDPAHTPVLLSTLSAVAYYSAQSDPDAVAGLAARAVALAEALAAAPAAPPAHRLALAEALVMAGNTDLSAGRAKEAGGRYDRAAGVFAGLPPTAPAGAVEQYHRTRAMIHTQRGLLAARAARTPADWQAVRRLLEDGLAPLDPLLAANPGLFPLLTLKYTGNSRLAEVCDKLGDPAGRDRADAARKAAADRLRGTPTGDAILAGAVTREAALLGERVMAGQFDGFDEAAAALLRQDAANPHRGAPVRYNIACGHAWMAKLGPPADRERHAVAAVALLAGLAAAGLLDSPRWRQTVATDADLDPLRDRADFQAVVAKASRPPPSPTR